MLLCTTEAFIGYCIGYLGNGYVIRDLYISYSYEEDRGECYDTCLSNVAV
jgi:hypothetical protein